MENSPVDTSTISGVNTGKALFQFKGHFYGRPVTWQCTLQTLDQHYQEMRQTGKIDDKTPVSLRKFIHITDIDSPAPAINIGLDVETIDEPTIRKTIVMVHNYKKLHAGLHEYGEIYHYPRE
jgi:hypothetical protein